MDRYIFDTDEVPKNKLGITDYEELKQAEAAICHVRMLELATHPVRGEYNFEHLKRIHYRLFADLYDFAGKERKVNMAKGGSRFCQAAFLDTAQRSIFDQLRSENYLRGLKKHEFVRRLAYFSGELNALHPFREGNGRAIRIFLSELAAAAGYELAYHDAGREALLAADISAFNGNLEPLIAILTSIVNPVDG